MKNIALFCITFVITIGFLVTWRYIYQNDKNADLILTKIKMNKKNLQQKKPYKVYRPEDK